MQESDPNGVDAHAPGAKLDAGKLRPWLMISGFSRALQAVADVTTKGAVKYTPNGWARVENGQERYMEALARHLLALGRGEEFDTGPNGTGCLHLAQVVWNGLAALELQLRDAEGWKAATVTQAERAELNQLSFKLGLTADPEHIRYEFSPKPFLKAGPPIVAPLPPQAERV